MVAINNSNLVDNFKIINSKTNGSESDDLFAELFALMNSGLSENESDNLVNEFLSKPIENQFLGENSKPSLKKSEITAIDINQTMNSKKAQNDKNEIELAKSLIQVFYKDFGIENNELTKKSISKEANAKSNTNLNPMVNLSRSNKKMSLDKNINSGGNNTERTLDNNFPRNDTQNFVIKVIKTTKLKDHKTIYHERNLFKPGEKVIGEKINHNKELNVTKKVNFSSVSSLVEKKIKKKTKQLESSSKEKVEIKNELQLDLKANPKNKPSLQTKNLSSNDSKILVKKDFTDKIETKLSDIKQPMSNFNGKELLDLMESSWGEKFSKLIKNSVNNGLNKLEVQLKPKNLGNLNLEISLKNNKTTINISSENQEVVNLLNDNLPKISEIIDRESKSFSSLMNNNNNNQGNHFSEKKNNNELNSESSLVKKKKNTKINLNKISNHNIDVNA